jgi:hypothetical protein
VVQKVRELSGFNPAHAEDRGQLQANFWHRWDTAGFDLVERGWAAVDILRRAADAVSQTMVPRLSWQKPHVPSALSWQKRLARARCAQEAARSEAQWLRRWFARERIPAMVRTAEALELYHLRNIIIRTRILNWLRFTYDFEIGSA